MNLILGIMLPFIGTTLGSAMVLFMKKNSLDKKIKKLLLGFSSGVMIAASIWSLIIPSIEMTENKIKWIPASIGYVLGIIFLLFIDNLSPKIKKLSENKLSMMILAVTLHNIPEGMAVGVVFAGYMSGDTGITFQSAICLALGIAIQNFPEGAIISMPLRCEGYSKFKSFILGVVSGVVEPIAAFITIALINFVIPILPYLLAFASGAMMYVVINELIPESQNDRFVYLGTIGNTIGFLIMMILDVTLG